MLYLKVGSMLTNPGLFSNLPIQFLTTWTMFFQDTKLSLILRLQNITFLFSYEAK